MSWSVRLRAQLGALSLDLTLEAESGPTVVVGPNGAGKTTLLRMIAGAHHPESGVIRVGAKEVFDSTLGSNVPPEERRVGYVPQGFGLFPHLRAVDNVAFGLSLGPRRRSLEERRDAARTLMRELDCEHLADRLPRRLSGGEKQRIALARALIVEPELPSQASPLPGRAPRRARSTCHRGDSRRAGC